MGNASDNLQSEGAGAYADQRLLHALLLHTHNQQATAHREQRVRRLMLAIPEPLAQATSPTPRHSASHPPGRALRFPAWAMRCAGVAALVLIVAGIFIFIYRPAPALASLNDILVALSRPGDRTFRIAVEPLSPDIQPRAGLNGATLYLRDQHQFLLVRIDPKGGSLFDGYDGQQSWRISGGAVAETKNGLGAGGLAMPQAMADTLFADLQPTLERIHTDYTVERLDLAPLPSGPAPLRHLLARRNSRAVKGPAAIEIWADCKTGMPRRIVFDQGKFQGSPQPRRLTFDLVSETSLPVDWFTPTVHTTGKIGVGPQPAR